MNSKDILKETIKQFNDKYLSKFKGETDPEKILYFQDILDNPYELNKQISEIPSLYAYWASMKRDAAQKLEVVKNYNAMWEQTKISKVVKSLNDKGIKTPTVAKIDAELKFMFRNTDDYKKNQKRIKEVTDVYEKICVIEKAVLTKMECLRIIAQTTTSMMATGIYVKKFDNKTKKGEF